MLCLNKIKFIFKSGCIIFTCLLIVQWVNRYLLDEDITIVESTSYYETEDDIFPVLTACFKQTFSDELFDRLGYNVKGSDYEMFLSGRYFDPKMIHIDYNSVTTNISDYILSYRVMFKNGTLIHDTKSNLAWKPAYESHSWNSWDSFVKCFSFEITDQNVYSIVIYLHRDIFPDGIRPQGGGFTVLFHYPNQTLSSIHSITRQWGVQNALSNYWMDFDTKGMDVVVRRYKRKANNCIQNWKNYDQIALEKLIKSVGCKAPYHNTIENWPICDSKDKMKKVIKHELRNYGIVPCREIESINYQVSDADASLYNSTVIKLQGKEEKRWFGISWNFLNFNFRKTINKKEVDLQSLFGWIGGYVGMFTGFAIAEIPEMLFSCVGFLNRLRKRFTGRDTNELETSN